MESLKSPDPLEGDQMGSYWKHILISVLLFLNCAGASFAAAEKPIGQIVWVKGSVKAIQPNAAPRVLQRRSPIFEKDLIVTDKSSTGQIVFTDNSMVSLRTNTEFRIDAYQFGKDTPAKDSKYVATVVKGGFRTITGLIPKADPENYKVKTPVATIAVQGTEYSVVYQGQLWVKQVAGTPCVSSGGGSVCLDNKNPIANVPTLNSAPVLTNNAGTIFKDDPKITPTKFNPNATPENPDAPLPATTETKSEVGATTKTESTSSETSQDAAKTDSSETTSTQESSSEEKATEETETQEVQETPSESGESSQDVGQEESNQTTEIKSDSTSQSTSTQSQSTTIETPKSTTSSPTGTVTEFCIGG